MFTRKMYLLLQSIAAEKNMQCRRRQHRGNGGQLPHHNAQERAAAQGREIKAVDQLAKEGGMNHSAAFVRRSVL